ncbi:hypothetical protein AOLI_G00281700 [Acnodon oligacanthus]
MSYHRTLRACARLGLGVPFGGPKGSRLTHRPVQPSHTPPAADPRFSVDFDQPKEAYKSKATLELLRNLLVLKLCSYDVLVDNNKQSSRLLLCPK